TTVLDVLARVVEEQSGDGLLATVLLVDQESGRLCHGAAPSLADSFIRALDQLGIKRYSPPFDTPNTLGSRRIVVDIATDPLWSEHRQLALRHGLRASWSTPVLSAEQDLLAALVFY